MNRAIVVTTIRPPTRALEKFSQIADWRLVVVGDRKGPDAQDYDAVEADFLSLEHQRELDFRLTDQLPVDHYSRKNIGYLYSAMMGATVIGESDDDNMPDARWSEKASLRSQGRVDTTRRFVNIYRLFSDEPMLWPRGFPLRGVEASEPLEVQSTPKGERVLLRQGLSNGEPDVDAIRRLLFGSRSISFSSDIGPVSLPKRSYCPVNSQDTIWDRSAFAYLYLPWTVSFRFTDILRGYVAQRGIWELDGVVAYGPASTFQDRNEHDLLDDFRSEIPCYLQVEKVVEVLDALPLRGDANGDIMNIYEALVAEGIVEEEELTTLRLWLKDLDRLLG